MRMLMNKICMGFRGFVIPKAVEIVMMDRAATAVESWKTRKFWML